MDLIKNLKENEFGQMEGEVYFSYLQKNILLLYDKEVPMEYVIKNINYLNSVDETVILNICKFSRKFCQIIMEDYPDKDYPSGLYNIKEDKEIMEYMEILCLKIDMFKDENIDVLNLRGGCVWDEDNGIQWLIKENEVVYVGPWEELDIWYVDLQNEFTNYVIMQY